MNTWHERVRETLLEMPSPILVVAGDEWGFGRVVGGLRDPERPLILVDARSFDCDDSVAVGNALSESLRRGLGASIFGLGVDAEYAFAALEAFFPALEPLTIAVMHADSCPRFTTRISRLVSGPNRLVVHTCTSTTGLGLNAPYATLSSDDLRVGDDEAVELFGDERDADEIRLAVSAAGGAIMAVEERLLLNSALRTGNARSTSTVAGVVEDGANGVVDALVSRGRWVEAFEFGVDHAPTRLAEILDEAGNQYFEQGQFERFWRYLSDVPQWAFRHERFMYWMFNAAIAVNRWRAVLPRVDRFLESNEAPDLRALRATVEINDTSLTEARRAWETRRSPDTARALGFIQEFRGEFETAIDLYKAAIELAEADGRPRHVVGAAAGMAQAYLFSGEYGRAEHWGSWALQQYHAHALREEILRISVVGIACYSRLLAGSVQPARQLLETVRIGEGMLGIPTVEGILSTLGDLAMIDGRTDDAIRFYKMNVESAPAGMYPTLANDLVHAYMVIGDSRSAMAIATKSGALAALGPGFQRSVARLNVGLVTANLGTVEAERELVEAIDALDVHPLGPIIGRAAIGLARSVLRRGRPEEARALLEKHAQYLQELGDSGWLLLGGDTPEVAQLRALFRNDEPDLRIRLLGKRSISRQEGDVSLSLRFAELIAVLAANPDGIRGAQLALALYGDRANSSTLKATISRTRKVVSIESLPYRIAGAYEADFMKVLQLLKQGKVQAALELYRGPLLPESDAPAVVEFREHLEESLRQAVLASGDPDAMIDLANQQGDDLELWEETRRHLPPNDPRRPLANARIRRIRKRWRSESFD